MEKRSNVPLIGFTTKPETPFAVPLRKPKNPPFFVSSKGCCTTPAIPEPTELIADFRPKLSP